MATGAASSSTVAGALALQFVRTQRIIHTWVDPLSTGQLWRRPFPFGNSIGHLLRHLTGNLNYYVGAQMLGTGYVRNRPLEFSEDSQATTGEVLGDFDAAIAMVLAALKEQRPEEWSAPYQAVGADDVHDRLSMFVRCAAHADHHAGQMIYLSKQLTLQ